jgi:hypothetical protein
MRNPSQINFGRPSRSRNTFATRIPLRRQSEQLNKIVRDVKKVETVEHDAPMQESQRLATKSMAGSGGGGGFFDQVGAITKSRGEVHKKPVIKSTRPSNIAGSGVGLPGGGLKLAGSGVGLPGGGLNLPGGCGTCPKGKSVLLPGDKLKLSVLKNMEKKKEKKMMGSGGKVTAAQVVNTLAPKILSHLSLKLSAKNKTGITKLINIRLKKSGSLASAAASVLLPVIMKLKRANIPVGKQSKLKSMLTKELSSGISKMGSQSGSGFLGKDKKFWRNFGVGFKRGFVSVAKPGLKVIGTVATATGSPEIGVPLGIISNLL